MSEPKFVFPKRLKTSHGGEATKGRSTRPRDVATERYLGLPKRRASDGPPSQWLLLYPLRPSVATDLIGEELRAFGDCRMVRSNDGYYALCEYQEKADAVEAKSRLHHSREPWVVRKEHATGYWADKAATGLKIDSVSRPKALGCLDTLGFPDVDGGWDSVLIRAQKRPRLSDIYRDVTARFYIAEDRAVEETAEATPLNEKRRQCRAQLDLLDYDSFDEDFDYPPGMKGDTEMRRSQVRSQLGLPDYDSFDEDL